MWAKLIKHYLYVLYVIYVIFIIIINEYVYFEDI